MFDQTLKRKRPIDSRQTVVIRSLLMASVIFLVIGTSLCIDVKASSFSIEGIPRPPSDQQSFLSFLEMTGQHPYSRHHRYPAHFATYRDYRILVYGHPAQVTGNRYDATSRQYAILGFSYDELKVTNTLFPDAAPGGVSLTTPFEWVELSQGSKALLSWSRLTEVQKRHLKASRLYYRNQTYGYMDFSALELNESNTIVLAPPSWHLGSAIYTQHHLPGAPHKEVRYATFYTQGGGHVDLSCDIDLLTRPDPEGYFTFQTGQDVMDISYRVSGAILAYQGLARPEDIAIRGVGSAGGLSYGNGDGPFTYEGTWRIDRSFLHGADEAQVTLTGTTFVVSAMGDIITREVSAVVPIRAPKSVSPLMIDAKVEGAIAFFSGSRLMLGQTPLASGRRFLGLETVWLTVRFSRPVTDWHYRFFGQTHQMEGDQETLEYRVPIRMPLDASTLTWHDKRIRQPHQIEIEAVDSRFPEHPVKTVIEGVELTGDIFDLLYVQK